MFSYACKAIKVVLSRRRQPFAPPSYATLRREFLLASRLSIFVVLCYLANRVEAQTSTWTGSGGNVNWSTAGNWDSVPVDSQTTNVIFAGTNNIGSSGTPLNQNIASPLTLNSLTFSSGGGSFFLSGNSLEFTGSGNTITQSSNSDESIANNIVVDPGSNNQTWTLTLNGNGTGLVTMDGNILHGNGQRDYALIKNGNSSFVLSGASTYGGGTTVNFGALFVNNATGSGTGTGSVSVTGGTLGGSGSVSGAVTVAAGASLSPGALGSGSTAIFRTGNLALNSGALFVLDLNSTTVGSGYDQVSVTGTVNIAGSTLSINPGGGLSIGDTFFILANNASDAVVGTFSQGATITAGNDTFSISYTANFDGGAVANDISLTLIGIVPEASTWISGLVAATIAIGHGIMSARRRRRFPKD